MNAKGLSITSASGPLVDVNNSLVSISISPKSEFARTEAGDSGDQPDQLDMLDTFELMELER